MNELRSLSPPLAFPLGHESYRLHRVHIAEHQSHDLIEQDLVCLAIQ